MRYWSFILSTGPLLLLSCCAGIYVRPLSREVKVAVAGNFPVTLSSQAEKSILATHTEAEYQAELITQLGLWLKDKNVVIDDKDPEFLISVENLNLLETEKYDTIRNSKSVDYGKAYTLISASVSVTGTVKRIGGTDERYWSATKRKSEKASTQRSIWQIITGDKNLQKQTHKISFAGRQFLDLTAICGHKGADRIARKIKHMLRKSEKLK